MDSLVLIRLTIYRNLYARTLAALHQCIRKFTNLLIVLISARLAILARKSVEQVRWYILNYHKVL